MDTFIFINQKMYKKYDFSKVDKSNRRFIAIITDSNYCHISDIAKDFFDKIYIVKHIHSSSPFSEYLLDKDQAFEVINKELKINPNPKKYTVICSDEFNAVLAGDICETFGMKGFNKNIILYRNKVLMKNRLIASGIRVPKFKTFDPSRAHNDLEGYFKFLQRELSNKFVIKPISGAASIETIVVENFSQYEEYCKKNMDLSVELEVDEYIEGELYHCDGFMDENSVIFSVASKYMGTGIRFLKGENAGSIPLQLNDPISDSIKNFTNSVINSLDYVVGPFHLELFKNANDELVFLEVGARPPGSNIPQNYQKLLGIDFFQCDLAIHFGEDISLEHYDDTIYSFTAYTPLKKGKIKEIIEPDLKSKYELQVFFSPGDVIPHESKSILDRSTMIVVYNHDYAILKEDFERFKLFRPLLME